MYMGDLQKYWHVAGAWSLSFPAPTVLPHHPKETHVQELDVNLPCFQRLLSASWTKTFSVICSSYLFICDSCCCFCIPADILIAGAFGFIILRQQDGEIRYRLVTPGCWNGKLLRSLVWKTRNSMRGPYMEQAFEIGLKQEVVCHFLSYLALTCICPSWKERI